LIHISVKNKSTALCRSNNLYEAETLKIKLGGKKVVRQPAFTFPREAGVLLLRYKDAVWDEEYKAEMIKLRDGAVRAAKIIARIKEVYGKAPFEYKLSPTSFHPMEHQKAMFNMMVYCDFGALDADPGTGKTASYLWAIDHLIKKGEIKRVAIITLKGLKRNVLKEMNAITPDLKGKVINGTAQYKKFFNDDSDIHLLSYEGMRFLDVPDGHYDMVILDEAHRIAGNKSKQTLAIIDIFKSTNKKFVATGTMHGNNAMSFFMPYLFLRPFLTGYAKYESFRSTIMVAVDDEKRVWKPTGLAIPTVQKVITPYTLRFKKEDCLDLPEIVEIDYEFDLSKEQKKVVEELINDSVAVIENMCSKCNVRDTCNNMCVENKVMVNHILVLGRKLQQVAAGYYVQTMFEMDEEGKEEDVSATISFDNNPRLEALDEILSQIPEDEKVLIWCIEKRAAAKVIEFLENTYGKKEVLSCYGKTDAFEVDEAFRVRGRFTVANPTKMGTGLNMQYVRYQVCYFIDHSYVKYDQMLGRSHRKGATEKVTIYRLKSDNYADGKVLKSVTDKRDMSEMLTSRARVRDIRKIFLE